VTSGGLSAPPSALLLLAALTACGGGQSAAGATSKATSSATSAASTADSRLLPCSSSQERLAIGSQGTGMNISIYVSAPAAASCALNLPIRLSLAGGAAGDVTLAVSGNPASATLVGVGATVDHVGPYADFFWSNWCGAAKPPYTAKATAEGTQLVATDRFPAAPPCSDPSKPSMLTLQVTGPPPTSHPQR
jgi:hypothetical protein